MSPCCLGVEGVRPHCYQLPYMLSFNELISRVESLEKENTELRKRLATDDK